MQPSRLSALCNIPSLIRLLAKSCFGQDGWLQVLKVQEGHETWPEVSVAGFFTSDSRVKGHPLGEKQNFLIWCLGMH